MTILISGMLVQKFYTKTHEMSKNVIYLWLNLMSFVITLCLVNLTQSAVLIKCLLSGCWGVKLH